MSGISAQPPLVAQLRSAGFEPGQMVGLAASAAGLAIAYGGHTWALGDEGVLAVAELEAAAAPRWVWWSAASTARPLLDLEVRVAACWDLAGVHRLLHGGWLDDPARIWAAAADLALADIPQSGQLDLLDLRPDPAAGRTMELGLGRADDVDDPVGPDGYLRPGSWAPRWLAAGDPLTRLARWAALALDVQGRQEAQLIRRYEDAPRPAGDPRTTARAESAAALLSVELELTGLPLDVAEAERTIGAFVGPRPRDEPDRAAGRRLRDQEVLVHARGHQADLRNPAQVKDLLATAGIDVPDTRSWRLLPLRDVHPLVDALLTWRKAERIDTTYGYAWLDRQVGPDGRLRGQWQASDGAAGRMTAQAGLHNLPAELRSSVCAPPGRLLVRADLGQIEPRVLAAVSGDPALAAAAREPDLYAPVAHQLRVDRPTAKVAVLAAMYGQTSGTAGQALRGMDEAYPVAMAYLRAADDAGRSGRPVTTYGGRLVPVWPIAADLDEAQQRAAAAARGRFTRNAVVQGAAAELFKAWAATVRQSCRELGAAIVLCLHDELLVEAPAAQADAVAHQLVATLETTATRWFTATRVRFVADVRVIRRWSDAKD